MHRTIRKVAVLGSGVMGSRIACHFAGVGLDVLLLDIVPSGVTVADGTAVRNRIVNEALQAAIKSNPSPVYEKDVVKRIRTGNFEDNLKELGAYDWIIEVVVERLDIKQQLFEKVEQYRKPGTLISSNTSGIPISMMAAGRSEDFRKHFCGTHFFNPPRYLKLLEIIPTPETDPALVEFLMHYGDLHLGKTTVKCKDTPAFIANRIGVFGMMAIMHLKQQLQLSIDEIDALTGPVIGRPKSATFRTADVVGIDTLVKVAAGVAANCPHDEAHALFNIPDWLQKMVDNKWLGDKSGQGFFKKTKNEAGKKEILTLDLETLTYQPRKKPSFATLEVAKPIEDLATRLIALLKGKDKAGEFYRLLHYRLFSYISHRIPEISDELYRVDDAMMAGFGWEIGAFETWDILGVPALVSEMEKAGTPAARWVKEMIEKGHSQFYKTEKGIRYCYEPASGSYKPLPGADDFLVMSYQKEKLVWKNSSCKLYDLGGEVLGLQWQTKMGSIGGDVLSGIQTAIEKAEQSYRGLVIGNEGANFSAGANVGMIFMMAIEQEYDELDLAIRLFQQTTMRARYSSVPVVVAPHGLALGGGCELTLHADKCFPAAETYTGLVELGVGLIPGGGGTKEFTLRAADEMHPDEPDTNTLKHRFMSIATAKVATSAAEAFAMGIYRKGTDEIIYNSNRRIAAAKRAVIALQEAGYNRPVERKDIHVLGRAGLGVLYAGIHAMQRAGYATSHDALIARKLAYVMCGGDLSEPTKVSEQYLLDLEREAFLSLCGEKKSLERIQSLLTSGKPSRN
ncbi:MAG: 3-hydroxyacyl-CoA dehydrogenase/enoyl-CoA hydratase family protein [Chitinophagia bacterium]|nr:3-hydroxyacyl-CoA dehydrogenase/enoyl-CoA hydratase family protein [Chitinophagia bacterium]